MRKRKVVVRPSDDQQCRIFNDVYRHIMAIDLPWQAKYAGMERILCDSKQVDHWRPVGVTRDALAVLAEQNFPAICKEIVRGHISGRKERAERILNVDAPLPDAWDIFRELDKVVIITKAENGAKRGPDNWSTVYPLPDDLFNHVEGYGLRYDMPHRQAVLRELWANHNER